MQNSRTTAGETATRQTKWGWGAVALVGLVAATTIEGSLILTAASVALFAIGSYLGGYMDESVCVASRHCEARSNPDGQSTAGERRAA